MRNQGRHVYDALLKALGMYTDWYTDVANATYSTCGVEPLVNHKFLPIFITFLAGAAVFVILRWIARIIMGMKLWWDDFLNFAAYVRI
jgi:hypothetical protein